jgi:hypothetical protein
MEDFRKSIRRPGPWQDTGVDSFINFVIDSYSLNTGWSLDLNVMAKRTHRPGFRNASRHYDPDDHQPDAESDYAEAAFSHRNRPGQSGLDPMDAYREWGFAQGLFIRNVLRLNARTRNPVYLLVMALVGAGLIVPVAASLNARAGGADIIGAICFLPFGVSGVLLLANVWLSIR